MAALPRHIQSSASPYTSSRPGTSGPTSDVRRHDATVITNTRPSRAMCCAVAIQAGLESHVGESRISMPSW
jgi:hypothetical protein